MALEKADAISVKFDGSNHAIWKFHFQFFVEGRGLWGYIDGSEVQPEESDNKRLNSGG